MDDLRLGQVVFSKRVRVTGKWNGKSRAFLEYGSKKDRLFMNLLIGIRPEKSDPPSHEEFMARLGKIGLFTLNDLEECLGKKASTKFTKYFSKKYSS